MIFFTFSVEKIIIPCSNRASVVPPKFLHAHKINLFLANSLAAAVSEPALHKLLTYHMPYFTYHFRCLIRTKLSIQVRGNFSWFSKYQFILWVVNTSPKPQAGGQNLVGCPRLLIQYIRSYPPYWWPFFHPQPEEAPCRGDRETLITVCEI